MRRSIRIAVLALACAAFGSAQAQLPPRKVEALHYGDTLFEFFQEKHFESLTGLMVSQHFDRVKPHDDQAEVLRGGLLLSYGLHKEASEVFARLIESSAPPPVRSRAWYHLAKIRYQRGLTDQAADALARVELPLPAPLEEDRQLLAAQLLMARADYAGAAAVLAALPPKASLVARYNLGVALVKAGDVDKGSALLDQIGQQPAFDEEQRALRDRANVALGFAALQNKQPADSRRYLQRVRMDGLSSNKALLGFGWAAAELGEPKTALAPWQELVRRPISDPAVLEARIAMPYALAEIGAAGQALEGYEQAVGQFDGERKALDQSIAAIRDGVLIEGLIANNPRGGMGWYGSLDKMPEPRRMPHGGHLTAVLAGHEFQEAFKNLRDLIFLGGNLEGWKDKLVVYKDMLANRQQAFAERLPKVRDKAGALQLPKVQERRDALAEELKKAEAETDVLAFADAKQRDALARVEAGHATLKAADPDEKDGELAIARERLRRVQGALTWQLTQTYPDRLWTAQKALKVADAELAQAKERDANLVRAAEEEPKRFELFAQRIAALEQRIAGLVPRVAALHKEQQAQLQDIAVAELDQQKERLEVYAQQARLAIAQLHDRAQLAQSRNAPGGTDAPR